MEILQAYEWPGNVRELENVIERAMIRSSGDTLMLYEALSSRSANSPLESGSTLDVIERRHIQDVLRTCNWRINGNGNAAAKLGLAPQYASFSDEEAGDCASGGDSEVLLMRHSWPTRLGVEEQLNEVRGANDLSTRFLQALQRFDADGIRGVELSQINSKGLERAAHTEQVRDLHICEASGHAHDMPSGLIRDVDPAFHVVASQHCNRRAITNTPEIAVALTARLEIW